MKKCLIIFSQPLFCVESWGNGNCIPIGKRVLKIDGAFAPRVLRFDGPLARGLWWPLRGSIYAAYRRQRCLRQRKPYNRADARRNAPLLPTAPLHGKASHEIFSRLMAPCKFRSLATPEGEVLAALCLELLVSLEAERRADFHLKVGKGTGFVGEPRDPRIQ